MVNRDWDVIVVGGGIAGLTATALLSKLNLDVLCIEPQKPTNSRKQDTKDLRSTAYIGNSVTLLKEAGVWTKLVEVAEPLKVMQICDINNSKKRMIASNFDSQDIGLSHFGYNIPNWLTKKSILSVINSSTNAHIMFGVKAERLTNRINSSLLKLSDDSTVSAKLIIGADGRNSDIRSLSGITIKKWDDNQDALAFITKHEKAHKGTSVEILDTGGPCTLVPLKSKGDGQYQSAVVWMDRRKETKRLMQLTDNDFSTELSIRTNNVLGPCQVNSKRSIYPIITQLADKFYAERVALIAESAHVMPPIGAQGLNTSFDDIELLVKLIKRSYLSNSDIGGYSLLTKYGELRRRLTKTKMIGITILNSASKSNFPFSQTVRKLGLDAIESNSAFKNTLMKVGLGKF
tara:strand:- start:831 stop:2039 length:1209 start_codon:yes stop_codon:yes gene_type:complete